MARASPTASIAVVEAVGARFIGQASREIAIEITRSAERATEESGAPVIATERIFRAAREVEQADDLRGLSRVGQGEHQVSFDEHPEVSVSGFGRVEEIGGSAGRSEGGGDLLSDEAGLADAGDAQPPSRRGDLPHRLDEFRAEIRDLLPDGIGLDLKNSPGCFEDHVLYLS